MITGKSDTFMFGIGVISQSFFAVSLIVALIARELLTLMFSSYVVV